MAGFKVVFHSIISGIFAASAGVAGKLAFDETLISNGCHATQVALKSSLVLSWIERNQFWPSVILFTDVCDHKVGPSLNFIVLMAFNILNCV